MKSPFAPTFDVHELQPGDFVEVFVDAERKWCRATFEITTDGQAVVVLPSGSRLELGAAMLAGIRPFGSR